MRWWALTTLLDDFGARESGSKWPFTMTWTRISLKTWSWALDLEGGPGTRACPWLAHLGFSTKTLEVGRFTARKRQRRVWYQLDFFLRNIHLCFFHMFSRLDRATLLVTNNMNLTEMPFAYPMHSWRTPYWVPSFGSHDWRDSKHPRTGLCGHTFSPQIEQIVRNMIDGCVVRAYLLL